MGSFAVRDAAGKIAEAKFAAWCAGHGIRHGKLPAPPGRVRRCFDSPPGPNHFPDIFAGDAVLVQVKSGLTGTPRRTGNIAAQKNSVTTAEYAGAIIVGVCPTGLRWCTPREVREFGRTGPHRGDGSGTEYWLYPMSRMRPLTPDIFARVGAVSWSGEEG